MDPNSFDNNLRFNQGGKLDFGKETKPDHSLEASAFGHRIILSPTQGSDQQQQVSKVVQQRLQSPDVTATATTSSSSTQSSNNQRSTAQSTQQESKISKESHSKARRGTLKPDEVTTTTSSASTSSLKDELLKHRPYLLNGNFSKIPKGIPETKTDPSSEPPTKGSS